MSNIVKNILSTVVSAVEAQGITGKREITKVALGLEEFNRNISTEVKLNSEASINSLDETLKSTIQAVAGNEEFTPAQIEAAISAAKLGLDPQTAVAKNRNLKHINSDFSVGIEDMAIDDLAEPIAAIESFDGQDVNNAVYSSIVYNLLAAKQDSFGEAFFPTITIDPAVEGAAIEAKVILLYKEFLRNKDGRPTDKEWNKISLVKALYDKTILGADKNKLIPVYRAGENDDKFAADVKTFVLNNGVEDITTAPLRFGKAVDILGVSQTDTLLAKGVMDMTDALDRRVHMQDVYFELTGKDADDNEVKENFGVNIALLPYSNFTYSTQGHNKDLMLSFSSEDIILNTSVTKTATGDASVIMANLPANHSMKIKLVLHGDGNRQTGTIAVYQSTVELIEVRNAAGEKIDPSSEVYADFKAVIDSWNEKGYTIEAYATNSNLRQRGVLAGVDIKSQKYVVPVRSGVTVLKPVTNGFDVDNDATYLATQISLAGARASLAAIETILNYADMLKAVTVDGLHEKVELMGAARFFVNAYYKEQVIDAKDLVDSIKSQERNKDIKAAIVNHIKAEVSKMFVESYYGVARAQLNGGVLPVIDVIIGTDPVIYQYLTTGGTEIDLGNQYRAHLVFTPNPDVMGKIFITFGVFDGNRNSVPNPLNFGQMFWSPEVVYEVPKTVNGATMRELTNMPRFLHVVNLPILSVMRISGLETLAGRIGVRMITD